MASVLCSAGMSQPAAPLPGLSSHLRAAVCHPGRPATLSCYLWHRVAMRGSLLDVLQMDLSQGSQGSRAESLCLLQGNVRSSRGWGMAERSLGRGEGQERPGDQRCGFVLGHTDPEPARWGEGSPRELPVGAGAWHAVRGTPGGWPWGSVCSSPVRARGVSSSLSWRLSSSASHTAISTARWLPPHQDAPCPHSHPRPTDLRKASGWPCGRRGHTSTPCGFQRPWCSRGKGERGRLRAWGSSPGSPRG